MTGENHDPPAAVQADYLIVGTGPAGASLAAFMESYGMTGLIVSRDPSNADTPRAHITNMAALDCLRDIGVDVNCYKLGTQNDAMAHTRWSNTMAGQEYGCIYSWGNGPKRKGDYELASPSEMIDLPQTLLQPLLMQYATLHGFKVRWNTELIHFKQDEEGVTTTLLDSLSKTEYQVRSKYLLGADGARSKIVQQAEIPLIRGQGQGFAVSVWIEADMEHLMKHRKGNLHWILQPNLETPEWGWIACMRMVKPWHEWLCVIFTAPSASRELRSNEEYIRRIQEMIGDDSVSINVLGVSTWAINDIAAEYYSEGRVFCLGDAVHRHPPNHGLGSNTCIQDAHNLGWKLNFVGKGWAGTRLLDSYSVERQPVGLHVVTQANASLRKHRNIWRILGNLEPTIEARMKAHDELYADLSEGRERRARLSQAPRVIERAEHGLGMEMNQRYQSSAVYQADQDVAPSFSRDPLQYYHATTYPGARLPHTCWQRQVSTFDGIGGDQWKSAAGLVSKELNVPIAAYSVGYGQDFKDVYLDWEALRGVEETGCVFVRPDYFVAWRSVRWEPDSVSKLTAVTKSILSLE